MSKKKPRGGDKPNRSPNYTLFARVSPALGGALEAYLASQRPRPTATSVMEVALEDFLKGKGFWPPPSPAKEDQS